MISDVFEVITTKRASLLSGIAEGNEACDNPFTSLEKGEEELENKTGLEDC